MEGRNLLVSDLDGTLLGDDAALAEFARWYERNRERVFLVYNSGRFVESIREAVRETHLPEPDAIVANVGTEVRLFRSGERLGQWPRAVERWDASRVRALLADCEHLELQPEIVQSRFKVSYYAHGLTSAELQALDELLQAHGIAAHLVYSSNRDLDVLPPETNKGTAAVFVAEYWQVAPQRTIVFGDSGNDAAMYQHNFRGVIVANAQPELKSLQGSHIYQARQSYAAGVLEGVHHWLSQ